MKQRPLILAALILLFLAACSDPPDASGSETTPTASTEATEPTTEPRTEPTTEPRTESEETEPSTESPTDVFIQSQTQPSTESQTDPFIQSPTQSPTYPPDQSPIQPPNALEPIPASETSEYLTMYTDPIGMNMIEDSFLASYTIVNNSDRDLYTGSEYSVTRYNGEEFVPFPFADDIAWTAELHMIPAGGSLEMTMGFSGFEEEFTPGSYALTKMVHEEGGEDFPLRYGFSVEEYVEPEFVHILIPPDN